MMVTQLYPNVLFLWSTLSFVVMTLLYSTSITTVDAHKATNRDDFIRHFRDIIRSPFLKLAKRVSKLPRTLGILKAGRPCRVFSGAISKNDIFEHWLLSSAASARY